MLECPICGHRLYPLTAGHFGQISSLVWCPEHGLWQWDEQRGRLYAATIEIDTVGMEV